MKYHKKLSQNIFNEFLAEPPEIYRRKRSTYQFGIALENAGCRCCKNESEKIIEENCLSTFGFCLVKVVKF